MTTIPDLDRKVSGMSTGSFASSVDIGDDDGWDFGGNTIKVAGDNVISTLEKSAQDLSMYVDKSTVMRVG